MTDGQASPSEDEGPLFPEEPWKSAFLRRYAWRVILPAWPILSLALGGYVASTGDWSNVPLWGRVLSALGIAVLGLFFPVGIFISATILTLWGLDFGFDWLRRRWREQRS